MKRVMKIHGHSAGREDRPVFNLPDGEYRVTADDGESIIIRVSHGPAATGVSVRMPAAGPTMMADVYNAHGGTSGHRLETRDVDITYYSPRDAYALAFKAWYDKDQGATYPGTREEWAAAQRA